jgi:large subunit ribosomal protein L29
MPTAHDLSMLDGDELASRLGESRRELFNLRFQLATGQLDNPARIGQVRREVARMLTVLRAREILEAEGAYVAPTAAEHEAARAKLAAEDAEREEKAAAKATAAEAEAGDHDHPGDDDIDDIDDIEDIDDIDDLDDDEEDEA